ncbi:SAM-dependent methyltransferase [Castellaniella daejeonensis]|jgi:SAM-dependent MidA family methyltransferase|uniref:SAM-dependent methyltransferase n=1 Tax=Castellaniella daejeonensis TaxID=659013 RepID=A0ABN0TWV2_9BURK|nr:SAM-dependent methyltransferase [Castellaniella sp.]HET8703034.1 SAM-dependent methyltransferase [Castellaniella sp.]
MIELAAVHIPSGLPEPDAEARAHGARVQAMLVERIRDAGGWLPFERWMEAALYAPGLGYYSAGSTKFHHEGDFTTAPETSPLFGQALARQVAQVLQASQSVRVLEFGAGSGALAAALIPALGDLGFEVEYEILELSADLRARQQDRLSAWAGRVRWLDALPDSFSGCVVANEVLDAMPAVLFRWNAAGMAELLGVALDARPEAVSPFRWAVREAPPSTMAALSSRMPPLPGYQSEMNPQAEAWVRDLGRWLQRGAALLIDYGFPRAEYYHPQRLRGTLMCHFRHHAHDQPLILAGLQDITAHVDFTAMADAALDGGLEVLGYTSQARFLMNAGLTDLIHAPGSDPALRARQLTALNTLLSEAEMGELFKVMAIGRGLDAPLLGFTRGDRRDRL